jgi:hypothetical protein
MIPYLGKFSALRTRFAFKSDFFFKNAVIYFLKSSGFNLFSCNESPSNAEKSHYGDHLKMIIAFKKIP